MLIFGIRDRKARRFTETYTDYTKESRERTFNLVAGDPKTSIGLYPTDYELYQIGELNEITGDITPCNIYITTGTKEN